MQGPHIGRQAAGCDNEERAACRRRARLTIKKSSLANVKHSGVVAVTASRQMDDSQKAAEIYVFPDQTQAPAERYGKIYLRERDPGVHRRHGVRRSGIDLSDKKQGRGGEDNNAGRRQADMLVPPTFADIKAGQASLMAMRIPSLTFCVIQLSTSKLASTNRSDVAHCTKRGAVFYLTEALPQVHRRIICEARSFARPRAQARSDIADQEANAARGNLHAVK
jgi:hypothetical protein